MSDYAQQLRDEYGVDLAEIERLATVVQNEACKNGNDSPVDYGDAEAIVKAVLKAQRNRPDGDQPAPIVPDLTTLIDTVNDRVPVDKQSHRIHQDAEALQIMKLAFSSGRATGANFIRAELLKELPAIVSLIGQLTISATRTSAVSKMMAESKSVRQTDNPERRTDLYSHESPSQTLHGQAIILLTQVLAVAMDLDREEVARQLGTWKRSDAT